MDINTFQSSFVCFHARLKSSLADQLWSYLWIKSFWKRLFLLGEIFQNFSMVKELFIWPGASTSLLWPVLLLFHCTFIFLFFVTQSCPTLCDPKDCSLPDSSSHGIFQARILEWVAISLSSRSSQPRDWTRVSRIAGRCFTIYATREVHCTNHPQPFSLVKWSWLY